MNKKAQEGPGLIVVLVLGILVIAIGIGFYVGISSYLSSRSNIEAVQTWVNLKAASGGTDIVVSETPPVIELEKPLEIKSEEDLRWQGNEPPKAFKEMADSMVDCWNAFHRGEKDFIKSIKRETYCFPCRAVTFPDEIKRNNVKVIGLNRYLNDQHTRGKDSPTYMQILANDNVYTMSEEELQDDEFTINDDVYVFFFAASGRGWKNIMTNILGGGDVEPETIAEGEGVTRTTTADLEALALTTAPAATPTIRYGLPTLGRKLTEYAATEQVEKLVATQTAEGILLKLKTPLAGQSVKKAAAKILTKTLLSKWVLFIPAKLAGWPLTVTVGTVGLAKVIVGEKPFSAKVLIVDPKNMNEICNA